MASLPLYLIIIKMGKLLCCILLLFLNSQHCFSSSSTSSSSPPPPPAAKQCHPNDSSALLQLKNALLVVNSTSNNCNHSHPTDNWNRSTDCCLSWGGVTCDESTGHVVDLDLSDGCLQGSIPSNSSLFLLSHLQSLNLTNNNFSFFSIPSKFGKLNQLQSLDLSFSFFSGEIPDTFGNLDKLNELYLAGNKLSGQIPPSIFSHKKLQVLDLGWNRLEGKLPYSISGLSNLSRLDFSHNMLSGTIPSWLFTIPSLDFLALSYNNLTGQIDQFQQNNIKIVDLRQNSLRGQLITPPTSTEYFMISNNQLSGEIPSSICNLTALKILDLSHNKLKGVVPQCIGNLSYSLSVIDLRDNTFNGSIPDTFEKCNNLGILNINHNNFEGELPRSLANCTSLEILDLGSNNISDTFPHWLEPLRSLRVLILRANGFVGNISHPMVKPPSPKLQILDVSHNNFTGALPATYLQNLTYMMEANVDDNPGYMGGTDRSKVYQLNIQNRVGIPRATVTNPLDVSCGVDSSPYGSCGRGSMYGACTKGCCGDRRSPYHSSCSEETRSPYHSSYSEETRSPYYSSYIVVDVRMKGTEQELPKILYVFTTIDFSSNQFSGEIPPAVGMLKSLKVLNFSDNGFTGRIPSTLGNLTELESLDLSFNKLVGEIPQNLTDMRFLEILNLSYNQLKGHIPQGKQFRTFSSDSFIGNLGLCGPQLSNKCESNEPPQVPPSGVDIEENSEGWFNWKIATLMGYGSGLVLGLSMGYIIFTTGRPPWFVSFVERKQYEILRRQKGRRRRRRV